jgi:diaminopimelate decarboxylase
MTTMNWEIPRISPLVLQSLNKFGQRRVRTNAQSSIDGVSIESLVERYGSPLYVTSEQRLRANIRRIRQAFIERYPNVIHGWSYKTNYNGAICSILHQEGSWAEVVSRFEYEKARSLGVPAEHILFNGPNKQRPILERAIAEGALIHVDHDDELELIARIAEDREDPVPVTLRLNFETGYTESWSRCGFNLESGAARAAIKRVKANRHLRLNGLHCHIGTFILDPRAYAAEVATLCSLAKEIESDGTRLSYIDIGGGLPSKNALQGIYLPPEQAVPDIEEYAEAICNAFLEGTAYRVENGEERPALVFESGRAVIDDAQSLIATVVGRKETADGRPAAIIDAGLNALFTALWYDHNVWLASPARGQPRDTVLYGPLCMNIDIVRRSVQLPPLSVGDHLVIAPVGAYNTTQSMQFIEYRPATVLIHGDHEVSVIREAEDLSVVTGPERLPIHLKNIATEVSGRVLPLRVAGG